MARPVTGDDETIELAQIAITQATTIDELRQAQAVLLPLQFGLSLEHTAQAIGLSTGWVCQLRRRFIAGRFVGASDAPAPGGRKRENMSVEQEREFLDPFIEQAKIGGVLVVGDIKAALDKRLGRTVALSSAYNLLHRHDWRKLVPDKRHPRSDLLAQEVWKKTPPNAHRHHPRLGRWPSHQADVPGRGALWTHLARAQVGVDPFSRTPYSVTRRSPRCPIPKRPIQRNFASR